MRITEEYQEIRPVVVGVMAFIIWLRKPLTDIETCFKCANRWVKRMEEEK